MIHEVVRDNLLDRAFHLELRCLPCVVQPSPEESVRTRLWMSKGRHRQKFLKPKVASTHTDYLFVNTDREIYIYVCLTKILELKNPQNSS